MSILKCHNLCLGYDGIKVIDNLNFTVEKGDFLSVVGENGVGKSTLVKAILGLINALDGEIIFGEGLSHSQIGYLPQQNADQRDFPASVYEIVRSGILGKKGFLPFFTKEDKRLVESNMEFLDISHLAKKGYKELSGGQQQRVLLARALCAAEKLILLDEPLAGLDPVVGAEFYNLISRLNKNGITVIMVSHDVESAIKYSTHILHLHKDGMYYSDVEKYKSCEMYKKLLGDQVQR